MKKYNVMFFYEITVEADSKEAAESWACKYCEVRPEFDDLNIEVEEQSE